jgi:hypothetical protein
VTRRLGASSGWVGGCCRMNWGGGEKLERRMDGTAAGVSSASEVPEPLTEADGRTLAAAHPGGRGEVCFGRQI